MHDDGTFTLGAGASVVNTGELNVSSSAHDAGEIVVLGEDITSSGVISADSRHGNAGAVELHARSTNLLTDNSLTSAISEEGKKGGLVKVLGHHVGLLDESRIDTSGALGGGEILFGGDFQGKNLNIRNAYRTHVADEASLYSNALIEGDGGKVIVCGRTI